MSAETSLGLWVRILFLGTHMASLGLWVRVLSPGIHEPFICVHTQGKGATNVSSADIE